MTVCPGPLHAAKLTKDLEMLRRTRTKADHISSYTTLSVRAMASRADWHGHNSQIGSSMYVNVNIIWFILILDDSIWTFYDIWTYLKYTNSIHLYPTFWICILGKTKPTWTYSVQQTGQVDGTLLKLFFVLHAFSMRLERVASREFWDFKALQPSALRHGPSQFHFAV